MNKNISLLYRVGAPSIVLIAILAQFVEGSTRLDFSAGNFFSFFTVLSNLFASGVLLYGAYLASKKKKPSATYDLVRGAATVYMVVTFIVVVLLLAKIQADLQLTIPWVNFVLHYFMPAVMVLDWLYVRPKHKPELRQAAYWLVYPAAYLVYSLVRGPIVSWYPYPFLSPKLSGGYVGVMLYCVGIFIGFALVVFGVRWLAGIRLFKKAAYGKA